MAGLLFNQCFVKWDKSNLTYHLFLCLSLAGLLVENDNFLLKGLGELLTPGMLSRWMPIIFQAQPILTLENSELEQNLKYIYKLEISIWECCELLNEVVNESDPDLYEPQIHHLLQTAEAIRKNYLNEDWLHLNIVLLCRCGDFSS